MPTTAMAHLARHELIKVSPLQPLVYIGVYNSCIRLLQIVLQQAWHCDGDGYVAKALVSISIIHGVGSARGGYSKLEVLSRCSWGRVRVHGCM